METGELKRLSGPEESASLRSDLRGLWSVLSWRAPRLRAELSTVEVVGTACGVLLVVGLAVIVAAQLADPPTMVVGVAMLLFFAYVTPLSVAQATNRRSLCRRLATSGLETPGQVIDRWVIPFGNPRFAGVRCSFKIGGSDAFVDVYDLADRVSDQYPIGRTVTVRYDPNDPRAFVIDCHE